MGTARRQYTDEFKREAVGLLVSSSRPLSQIAEELGIPAARLRAWRNRSGGGQAGSPRRPNTQAVIPPAGTDLAAENARLRRDNERLRMEREILKKRCASSRSHRNEIPHHRGAVRNLPGSRLMRCHERLSVGVLCLARQARKPAQGGQSRPARRDPAPPFGLSRVLWRTENPCGLARPGAHGEPWPGRAAHAPSRYPGTNAAPVPGMHHRQPPRLAHCPQPARPEIRRRAA